MGGESFRVLEHIGGGGWLTWLGLLLAQQAQCLLKLRFKLLPFPSFVLEGGIFCRGRSVGLLGRRHRLRCLDGISGVFYARLFLLDELAIGSTGSLVRYRLRCQFALVFGVFNLSSVGSNRAFRQRLIVQEIS